MGADKPALVVGGSTLLGSVIAAARAAGAAQVIVVGPPRPGRSCPGESRPGVSRAGGDSPICRVQEDPPAAGPVPALRRGLAEVTAPVVALLAADLPFLQAAHLRALRGALRGTAAPPAAAVPPDVAGAVPPAAAGVVLLDDAGRPQWLASCWDAASLRRMAGSYRGSSLRGMLGAGPAGRSPAGPGGR